MRNAFDDAYNGRTVYVLHRLQGSHNVIVAIKNDWIGSRDTEAAEPGVRSIPLVRRNTRSAGSDFGRVALRTLLHRPWGLADDTLFADGVWFTETITD
jgi:hypothetical protein